jgi:hypothetical protein
MKYLFLLFVMLTFSSVMAQEPSIEWGELKRKNGQVHRFMPTSSQNEFYALRWTGGRIFGSYLLTKQIALNTVAKKRVQMHIDGSIANFVRADLLNDQCAVFLSDIRGDSNRLYIRLYDENLEEVVSEQKLASYGFEKGSQKGAFGVRFSENRKFLAVVWEKPGRRKSEHTYGYRVFNSSLVLQHEGEYKLPYRSDLSDIQGHYLSNRGDYFLAVTEFDLDSNRVLYRNQLYFKSLHLFHIDQTGLLDYEVELDSKRIYTITLSTDDSTLINLSGLYGFRDENGIRGVFYQKIDLIKEKKLDEGFRELSTDIITEGWSDRALRRVKKWEERGKDQPLFFNYEMRETITLPDSSIVGAMEQHFIQERLTDVQQSGLSSNTFYYYYNDIVAYKIGQEGNFDWVKKIRKYQVSTNDGGPYSGYISFYDSTNLYFLFNDHRDNYSPSGDFIDREEIYITNYGKRRNVIALTNLDYETGNSTRKVVQRRSEAGLLFVPKLCFNDHRNNQVIVYSIRGGREAFGLIRYSGNR